MWSGIDPQIVRRALMEHYAAKVVFTRGRTGGIALKNAAPATPAPVSETATAWERQRFLWLTKTPPSNRWGFLLSVAKIQIRDILSLITQQILISWISWKNSIGGIGPPKNRRV